MINNNNTNNKSMENQFNIAVATAEVVEKPQVVALTNTVNAFMEKHQTPIDIKPLAHGKFTNLIVVIKCNEEQVVALANELLQVPELSGFMIAPRRMNGKFIFQKYNEM